MKHVIESKIPIKIWCDKPEAGAIEQALNLSNLPFAFKHIALMPDTHQGYGMPIGGVLATENVIVPNAVGVDIGCGMCCVKTSLVEIETETLKKIMSEIRKVIPVGFDHQKEKQDSNLMPYSLDFKEEYIVNKEYQNALLSLGTLGGGNHFIEIQKGSDGFIYIMIHSGSRNLGKQVADFYNKEAINMCEKYYQKDIVKQELAFLPVDSIQGQNYLKEMQYCVDFALANRKLMMDRIINIIGFYGDGIHKGNTISFYTMINIAHNYAKLENHFGKNVWVHRKGATSARVGEIGLIPGSQGTLSYIVKGKGNQESFMSCSHGAGRKMGRNEAMKNLNLEEEQKILNDQGILHAIRGKNDLDEASGAYKDIKTVMQEQEDLVEILVELKPLAVIKG